MNWPGWLLWGFAATVVLSTVTEGSQAMSLTRMNIPYMLGTMFTPNRDRAKLYGVLLHLLNGWAFSLLYVAAFELNHVATWWFGAAIGFLHGAFVLAVGMQVMPAVHPRMASPVGGPDAVRQLEPPGFLAKNYGTRTPFSVMIAHLLFGATIGAFYVPHCHA